MKFQQEAKKKSERKQEKREKQKASYKWITWVSALTG